MQPAIVCQPLSSPISARSHFTDYESYSETQGFCVLVSVLSLLLNKHSLSFSYVSYAILFSGDTTTKSLPQRVYSQFYEMGHAHK